MICSSTSWVSRARWFSARIAPSSSSSSGTRSFERSSAVRRPAGISAPGSALSVAQVESAMAYRAPVRLEKRIRMGVSLPGSTKASEMMA
jgi:hypothetical protein